MPNFEQWYAWAAGHDVAQNALQNIANQLYPHNRRGAASAPRAVGIKSPILDIYPTRRRVRAGYFRGDGQIDQRLEMLLTVRAVDFVFDTYLSGRTVAAAPMTLYTRRHELDSYARYNCYLNDPSPSDLVYLRQNLIRVTWTFTDLEAL